MDFSGFNFPAVSLPALVLLYFTSLVLLLTRHWRLIIVVLALQYLGIFILTAFAWPIAMAAVKLVAGWMACAVLGAGMAFSVSTWEVEESPRISNQLMRFLFALLVGLVVFSSAQKMQTWFPKTGLESLTGSMALIGMGILHLGITLHPFRVVTALLTVLGGFEILYASLEVSVLVAGLLAVVNLGLALVGAYLLVILTKEPYR